MTEEIQQEIRCSLTKIKTWKKNASLVKQEALITLQKNMDLNMPQADTHSPKVIVFLFVMVYNCAAYQHQTNKINSELRKHRSYLLFY